MPSRYELSGQAHQGGVWRKITEAYEARKGLSIDLLLWKVSRTKYEFCGMINNDKGGSSHEEVSVHHGVRCFRPGVDRVRDRYP